MNIFFKTEKGMSLTELLVAMFILGIVSAGISAFFVNIWKNRYNEVEMGKSLIIVSQAVSKMEKNIRQASQADSGAYLIDSADDFDFVFYANIDDDDYTEKVHYYLDGDEIKMESADPIAGTSPTYPETYDTPVVIADNIVNTASEPIFTYYDNSYSSLVTPASVSPIRLIKISVFVNTDPDKISDVNITSLTSFRNIDS